MRSKQHGFLSLLMIVSAFSLNAETWTKGTTTVGSPAVEETIENIKQRSVLQVEGPQKNKVRKRLGSHQKTKQHNPESLEASSTHKHENINQPSALGEVNFTAVTLEDIGTFPPDSMGAVGTTQYLAFCNDRIRTFDKTNGQPDGVLNVSTNAFFASQLNPGDFTSDPRVRFDFFTNSWFAIMLSVPESFQNNKILIAVCQDAILTVNSVWQFFSFEPDSISPPRPSTDFDDFPTLGIDRFALYVGINIFDGVTGNFRNSDAYVINKQDLLDGKLTVTVFRDLLDPVTLEGPFTPQGVDNFDTHNLEGFFIGVDEILTGHLVMRRISDPAGSPQISQNIPITVLSTTQPLLVPHKGNTGGTEGQLEVNDDRLGNAVVRNNLLYTSHIIGVNNKGISSSQKVMTRDGSRWYEIDIHDPSIPQLIQSGTLFKRTKKNNFNAQSFWMPSVMVNKHHKLVLGCSSAGVNRFANAVITFRLATDPLGTLRAPTQYTNSTTAYNPPGDPGGSIGRRWGDFSNISLDPTDGTTMWAIEEFCNETNSYGCQVVKIP